ncbi:MAG TPA: xanthine dehydrogenase family protein subunit M [Stellaceae bacterium]|jgi:xanthine dehydrogenase YagS FAD-binding subunit
MSLFAYSAASSPQAASERALQIQGADFIAGGTDMMQLITERVRVPREVIDINALSFTGIHVDGQSVRIGALERMSDVADDAAIRERFPAVAEALLASASPQVRNMATMGGNLLQRTRCLYFRDAATPCNKRVPGSGCPARDGQNRHNAIFGTSERCIAAHASDLAVALVALDARVALTGGPQGDREIAVAELHRLPGDTPHLETVLEPGELIAALILPDAPFARRSHYLKVRDRASFEWALTSAAVGLDLDDAAGTIRQARVAVGGVGTKPWRLPQVEAALAGSKPDAATFRAAAERAVEGAQPRGGNAFKVELVKRTVARALAEVGGAA